MAKIERGRLNGLYGMRSWTSAQLLAWADRLEDQIRSPQWHAAVRQISIVWQAVRIVPMIRRLMDWEKAEQLLEGRGGVDEMPS